MLEEIVVSGDFVLEGASSFTGSIDFVSFSGRF